MIKSLYIAIAVVVLLPSLIAGVMTFAVAYHTHKMARETPRAPGERVYAFTDTLTFAPGKVEVDVYPRVWAAVLTIVGAAAWFVGAVVLLFVRHV